MVFREAIGCCLGIAPIVEEVIGCQAHRLAADARLPSFVPDVVQILDPIGRIDRVVVLPIVGIGSKAGTCEREINLVGEFAAMYQVAHAHRVAHADGHERQRETDVGHQVAVDNLVHILDRMADVIGAVVTVEGPVAPQVGPVAEHHKLGIAHRAVLEVHMAVLEGAPPIALVAGCVIGLVEFLLKALIEPLLGLLDPAQALNGINRLLQAVLLQSNKRLRHLSPRQHRSSEHE